MRIAFVVPGGGGGGVRSVLRIASGLMQHGHELTIYHRREPGGTRNRLRSLYHAVRYGRGSGWLGDFTGRAVSYDRLTPQVVGDYDCIVGVGVSCVLELENLPQRCGIKVHNSRGTEPWCEAEMARAWSLTMPRIVVGTHLVTLMRQAGSNDPIFVAPNGIDVKDYFPFVPESERDGVGVVYHGAPVKDPEMIVGVLNTLAQRRPNLRFNVFSTFPNPGSLPAGSNFVRFPSLADARSLYSRSLVWFMASRNEGFGNPLLEAASCGCALVSTDCGGARDIIDDGKSGLIVPVGDMDAMVAAIESILDDLEIRTALRAGATATARRFTWECAITKFEDALKAIVAGHGRDADSGYGTTSISMTNSVA